MAQQVLILGGAGRIGFSVAQDVLAHTAAEVMITGRQSAQGAIAAQQLGDRARFLALDLAEEEKLKTAIAAADLVIHCAGPFHYRDGRVLDQCIAQGVPYLDVSDNAGFTQQALAKGDRAAEAGVTAIVNTGIFPGISNSLVKRDVEQLDQVDTIHLSYIVAGSGGAGLTVMRTTFLGLQRPFQARIDGQWQEVQPYTEREAVEFPAPYGRAHVYWYEMPETVTLANTFNAKTVITKFGSLPDFYNHLTGMAAHRFPAALLQNPGTIEFLSRVSYAMTNVTDRFSGIGVAMRSQVTGTRGGEVAQVVSSLAHPNTAIAAGAGTGSLAELLLTGQLQKPGVWPVEAALSTAQFEATMAQRQITLYLGQPAPLVVKGLKV